ncbi:hypothetical protein Snas_4419 [Stackebrandtia nassauensis DSM 44728]|uniref:Uncharacterized protein n=1 Tax=Stackebrandtia nassauensis (strain DSM 44728 / CIP 108903 / NRRL B-16338 / NBRC 102104 / LLR-40K-21) TaxID=446470 RepID=D3Q516_STANL|nr:hypothetical protein Snas_4419 [Stackebrandtia nassauensis DSM 44728]
MLRFVPVTAFVPAFDTRPVTASDTTTQSRDRYYAWSRRINTEP